jgi:putative PEP-CTERM system TPR-repeat lipoprotein
MGDYRTGYLALIHAAEVDPKHTAAQTKLAEVIGSNAASTRDTDVLKEAEQRVQSVLAVVPGSPEALGALGITEYLLGKPDEAVKHLEAALEKFPKHLQSAKVLAVIKLNGKDFAGAEAVLKKVAEQPPQSAEAYVALGRFYALYRRAPEAEAAYKRAIALDPKDGVALLDLVRLQFWMGRKEDAEKTLLALSQLPDKRYRGLRGIYMFEQGNRDHAMKEFERQVREDPDDREAFQRLTTAYFLTNRLPDAEKAIDAALKKNPKNADALLQRSRLNILSARFAEAETDLDRVLKIVPNSAAAHFLLARIYQSRGLERTGRDQLGLAVQYDPSFLAARLELARLWTASGAAKSALQLLDQTPQDQAQSLPVILERNWALLKLGERVRLRKSLDSALAMYRGAPDLLLQDGMLKLQTRDLAGSRKSFTQVLAVRPQSATAVDALAKSYLLEKQPSAALQTVERQAAQQSSSAAIQGLLGEWLAGNKRFDEARKAFQKAIEAAPGTTHYRIEAGFVEIAAGKLDDARRILQAVPRSPDATLICELGLAQVEEKSGAPLVAIPHYRKALEVDADNVPALNGLAYNLASWTSDLDEALKYAERAKELAANDIYVEDTIGWVYFRKGFYAKALDHLQSAVSKGGMPVPKYHLAMAYFRTGDTQRGMRLLEEARRVDPNLPESALAQKLLADLVNRKN